MVRADRTNAASGWRGRPRRDLAGSPHGGHLAFDPQARVRRRHGRRRAGRRGVRQQLVRRHSPRVDFAVGIDIDCRPWRSPSPRHIIHAELRRHGAAEAARGRGQGQRSASSCRTPPPRRATPSSTLPTSPRRSTTAGLTPSQISVKNAQGSDSTFVTDAEADITNGASVLLIDPEDPGTGARVAKYAAQHGVQVIDYDRITQGSYYISFNNVQVGHLIGIGFAACAKKWNVTKPDLIKMVGAPTDNNATLFAQGYNAVIKANPSWKVAASPPGTWTPSRRTRPSSSRPSPPTRASTRRSSRTTRMPRRSSPT